MKNAPIKKSDTPSILEIKDWPTYFETVRLKPAMYFGSASITALRYTVMGIKEAELFYKIDEKRKFKGFSFEKFEEWVDQEFNTKKLAVRSFHLAKIKAKSEEKAFTLWFQWYDAYKRKEESQNPK